MRGRATPEAPSGPVAPVKLSAQAGNPRRLALGLLGPGIRWPGHGQERHGSHGAPLLEPMSPQSKEWAGWQ